MGRQGGVGRSVMTHQFSQTPQAKIERSSFDRSHGFKTTFNEKYLIPVYVDEVLPGDTFSLSATLFGRLATPIFPFMDNLYLDVFFFYVPIRLIWTHFVNMMGEQANPSDTTSYLVPTITITGTPPGAADIYRLTDYFGIPIDLGAAGTTTVNSLPYRCYNKIWNDWFRDENLQNSVVVDMSDGPDAIANYAMLPRGKRKDYFTSALPWPQKGPAIAIPLGGAAPVFTGGSDTNYAGNPNPLRLRQSATGTYIGVNTTMAVAATVGNLAGAATAPGALTGTYQPANLYADLLNASGTLGTINQLRQAFQIQKIYERDARGGTRYIELIKSHFGVTSPDARLQRSEYLGGGSAPINVNPIAQTSATGNTGGNTPQGNLAAMGTVHTHGSIGFSKSFTEHGYVIGLVNARADITYQEGLDKLWSRSTRFDFYWPALAHIGEQAVLNQEIFLQGTGGGAADTGVFGYQERYAEYRYKNSRITGQFRSRSSVPLDAWHLSQHFTTLPVLNDSFIQDSPPISRVVAVPSQPRFLLDIYFKLRCARPMPVYSVPGLVDHF